MTNPTNTASINYRDLFESFKPKDLTDKVLLSTAAVAGGVFGLAGAGSVFLVYGEKKLHEWLARPAGVIPPVIPVPVKAEPIPNLTSPPAAAVAPEAAPLKELETEVAAQPTPQILGGGEAVDAPAIVEEAVIEEIEDLPMSLPVQPGCIENGGNTCYLSSLLWSYVFENPPLIEELRLAKGRLKESDPQKEEKSKLIDQLRKLCNAYQSGTVISKKMMNDFRNALIPLSPELNDGFVRGQKDANLALLPILDLIFENSPVKSTFQVEKDLQPVIPDTQLASADAGKGVEPQGWRLQLNLPIDDAGQLKKGKVRELINQVFNEDHTDEGADQWQRIDYAALGLPGKIPFGVKKVTRKWKEAPFPFLTIVLKRFIYRPDLKMGIKLVGPLEVPKEIHFGPEHYELEMQSKYQLKSFVYHNGTLEGGHYTAFLRRGDNYYHLNDSPPENCEVVQKIDSATFFRYANYAYMLNDELKA